MGSLLYRAHPPIQETDPEFAATFAHAVGDCIDLVDLAFVKMGVPEMIAGNRSPEFLARLPVQPIRRGEVEHRAS